MKQLTVKTIDNINQYNQNYLKKRNKDLPKFMSKHDPIILNNELIPTDGAIVFCGNHDHVNDQYLVIAAYEKSIHWMAKEEYFETPKYFKICKNQAQNKRGIKKVIVPFTGLIEVFMRLYFRSQITKSGAVCVDRFGDTKSSLNTAIALAKNGENIGIFPEGTRKKVSDDEAMLLDFKKGAAIIARESDAYLQPYAKIGLFEDDDIRPVIIFGSPFKGGKMSVEEATKKLQNGVLNLKKKLQKKYN